MTASNTLPNDKSESSPRPAESSPPEWDESRREKFEEYAKPFNLSLEMKSGDPFKNYKSSATRIAYIMWQRGCYEGLVPAESPDARTWLYSKLNRFAENRFSGALAGAYKDYYACWANPEDTKAKKRHDFIEKDPLNQATFGEICDWMEEFRRVTPSPEPPRQTEGFVEWSRAWFERNKVSSTDFYVPDMLRDFYAEFLAYTEQLKFERQLE